MERGGQIPWPEKVISWLDIAKGMGQLVFHTLTDQFRHEGVSEHFVHDPLLSPLTPEARQGWVEQQRAAETALRASQEALNGE